MHVCLCMYVCACMYVIMQVCMYACTHVRMSACMHLICICIYACMHACMYACTRVCICAYTPARMIHHNEWSLCIILMNLDDFSWWIMMVHHDEPWRMIIVHHHDESWRLIMMIYHDEAPCGPERIPFMEESWPFSHGRYGNSPRHFVYTVAFLPWLPWHLSHFFAMAPMPFVHAETFD